MRAQRNGRSSGVLVTACCVGLLLPLLSGREARAQGAVGGVSIDAQGMLRDIVPDVNGPLVDRLPAQSNAASGGSSFRCVSLRRLEARIAALRKEGQALDREIPQLAGLTRVTHVFRYPSANGAEPDAVPADVVLGGPAEVWTRRASGDVVGTASGRPVLQLDDLAVALRYAFDESPRDAFLGCSIDPTPEGVRRHGAYLRRYSRQLDADGAAGFFEGLERALGTQTVSLFGVPPDSRFALTMLAADYRLKRLALGHDALPEGVPSYLDLAARSVRGSSVQQHRWWFVGRFDRILQTEDQLALELRGEGLQVQTAASRPASPMSETAAGPSDAAATKFADALTQNLPAAMQRAPVLAALANLVGLSLAAELVAEPHFDGSARANAIHWEPAVLLDDRQYPIERGIVPRSVPPLTSHRRLDGRTWLIATSGGVSIDPQALAAERQTAAEAELSDRWRIAHPPADDRWWWDARLP